MTSTGKNFSASVPTRRRGLSASKFIAWLATWTMPLQWQGTRWTCTLWKYIFQLQNQPIRMPDLCQMTNHSLKNFTLWQIRSQEWCEHERSFPHFSPHLNSGLEQGRGSFALPQEQDWTLVLEHGLQSSGWHTSWHVWTPQLSFRLHLPPLKIR